MIDYASVSIERMSVHRVGNKQNNDGVTLSKEEVSIKDNKLKELLVRYFLPPFTTAAFYNFTFTNDDFNLNPLYNFASSVFDNLKTFHANSVNIARHLYEVSNHPQIKSGDLFIAFFSDLAFEGEFVNAIGIFKSENKHSFLKLNTDGEVIDLHYDEGISIEKLDKGCLILDVDRANGYKVCMIDKANKSIEAQFWTDSFLMLLACKDEYHQTKNFLDLTKSFVTHQLSEEFEVDKTHQIDMLNRSMEYFKTHDSFDKKQFEKEVFQEADIIKSFRTFDDNFRADNAIDLEDKFEISASAVKKQARVFKSILKLDKNFHIYIHGNKDLIEQGVEKDGRKYYKIYFEKEE